MEDVDGAAEREGGGAAGGAALELEEEIDG